MVGIFSDSTLWIIVWRVLNILSLEQQYDPAILLFSNKIIIIIKRHMLTIIIVVLSTIIMPWDQSRCPKKRWMDYENIHKEIPCSCKEWRNFAICFQILRPLILSWGYTRKFTATTWFELENNMLNEVSQTEKQTEDDPT